MAYFPRRRKNSAIRKYNGTSTKIGYNRQLSCSQRRKKVIRMAEIFSIVQFCFGVTEIRGASAFSNMY